VTFDGLTPLFALPALWRRMAEIPIDTICGMQLPRLGETILNHMGSHQTHASYQFAGKNFKYGNQRFSGFLYG